MTYKITLFAVTLSALSLSCARPTSIAVIPQPVSITPGQGAFALTPETTILSADKSIRNEAAQLADSLNASTGFHLHITDLNSDHQIRVILDDSLTHLGNEGYQLIVTANAAEIRALKPAGVFYGCQTLLQLLSKTASGQWQIPCVEIKDYPRFRWRGMHLDVCRHFMPAEFVKKYIDLLAMHKMNTLHWHLTDDQGWRIEIKKYPKLTEVGAWRDGTKIGHNSAPEKKYDSKRYGGFYTQEQIRDIVAYAKQRHINIVPEIEMPGHCQAAVAAYPELGCTGKPVGVMQGWGVSEDIYNVREETFQFIENVLTEVMDLFDSPFIHVGGDEVPKIQWKQDAYAQAKMKELGLKNEDQLQSWFIHRIDAFLTKHNRRLIGWDEILEGGLAPGAAVMSWRGEVGGIEAAKAGHDVVMTPGNYTYFDHYQADPKTEPMAIGGFTTLEKVYHYEPVPAALDAGKAKHILGAQGQIWTEYIATPQQVEYMAYPRAIALAEVLWTPKEKKDYAGFIQRLLIHSKRLDSLNVNYCPLNKAGFLTPKIRRTKDGVISIACFVPSAQIYYTLDGSEPTAKSKSYAGSFSLPDGGAIQVVAVCDGKTGTVSKVNFGPCKKGWKILAADSTQPGEDADNAIDDNPETWWHTEYLEKSPAHPHTLDIDLGKTYKLKGATYTPRPSGGNGTIKECEFYTSPDGKTWTPGGKGLFEDIKRDLVEHPAVFEKPVEARYLRFLSVREINGNPWTSVGEIGIIIDK
jgi:hexosaminidase